MRPPVIIPLLLTGPWLLLKLFLPGEIGRGDFPGPAGVVLAFCFLGAGHFAMTDRMVDMFRAKTPGRRLVVPQTGVPEFVLAVGRASPATRNAAGLTCVPVLIGFFRGNACACLRQRGRGHARGPI